MKGFLCDLCVPLRSLRYKSTLTQRTQRYAEIAEKMRSMIEQFLSDE
jgi:hypothetical protein